MSAGTRSAPLDRLLRPLHKWVWSDHDRRVRKLLIFGDVETDGTLTYGATVFDRRRRPECQPNMDVAIDMDTAAVADCIVRGLAQVA